MPHIHRSYEGVFPGKDGWPGPTRQDTAKLALFNLRRDPGERYDVKEMYPDVVEELMKLVESARNDLGDDLTDRTGKNVREGGRVKRNDE